MLMDEEKEELQGRNKCVKWTDESKGLLFTWDGFTTTECKRPSKVTRKGKAERRNL